jgi:protein-disulfide isomerase
MANQTARISKRQQRAAAKAKAARLKRIRIIGFLGIAVLTAVALIFWRSSSTEKANQLITDTPPNLLGPADAPVRIVEFGDFGCPACRAWHNSGVKDQLIAEFGSQISFEFRHFPVITAQSPLAAEAAQCAAAQGAFWAFHDYIYENTSVGALSKSDLEQDAAAIGLNTTEFNACLDSGQYQPLVRDHYQQALQAGARGTPTFLINGQQVSFSYDSMAATIRQILGN